MSGINTINPATGEILGTHAETSDEALERYVTDCALACQQWGRRGVADRAPPLRAAAELLRGRRDEYARLMAREMGKPISQGRAEAEKCAWACDYFAERAGRFLGDEAIQTDAQRSYAACEPLGVVLAVMPWNFPFWQVFRFAAPALMAGNGVILKHASNVPGCALAIEKLLHESGFPVGLLRAVLIDGERAVELLENPAIRAVTLTGSAAAGRVIAAKAGQLLKKSVLELGGSDPYVLLEDCDLERAVENCVRSRLINGGQSCIAAKRFIVVEPLLERFERRFVQRLDAERMGDPLAEDTTLGPLAKRDLRETLHAQVENSIRQGARLVCGGDIPTGKGWFYPPTVLAEVRKGMPVFDEETFGPVAAIVGARDEAEAIRVANDSRFGLGAAVFTKDPQRGERIAREELEAGNCFVNAFVKSDPRLPFGGIKESGYGRELSVVGIREFVNLKTVYVA